MSQKFSGTSYEAETLEDAFEFKTHGDHEASIKIIHSVILENPFLSEAYEELADNYMSLSEGKKAKKALIQAMKIMPKSSNAHYLMGFILSSEENWRQAIKELELANEYDPNHSEILRCLGWAYYNGNHVLKGTAILERARVLSPSDPNILCDLGVCYMNSFRYVEAKKLFTISLEIDENCDQAKDCLRTLEQMRMDAIAHKLDPRNQKSQKEERGVGVIAKKKRAAIVKATKKKSSSSRQDDKN